MVKFSKLFAWLGLILFTFTTIIAGYLYPDYSHISQFISESYAIDAKYGFYLRWLGFIPSGIFLSLFFFYAWKIQPKSIFSDIGMFGFIILYGLGTIICSIFYCDKGCNPENINPSLSQIIHNIIGGLFYLCLPLLYLFIFIASNKWKNKKLFSHVTLFLTFFSLILIIILFKDFQSYYKGLYQRMIEGTLLLWIIFLSYNLNSEN
ncbi:MAG: DUF998 domain-containing protein [Flavobacterium sp.]|jgi:hypothetical protein|uniref:DUF998 domain-containing protein n=1 Tax=Flavobacterium sp. TaxID=239 RepID=UPI003BA5BF78